MGGERTQTDTRSGGVPEKTKDLSASEREEREHGRGKNKLFIC